MHSELVRKKMTYNHYTFTDEGTWNSKVWPEWMQERFIYNTAAYKEKNALIKENGMYYFKPMYLNQPIRKLWKGMVIMKRASGEVFIRTQDAFVKEFESVV